MQIRFGMKSLLGIVLGAALLLALFSHLHSPPWEKVGGMIGWSQAAIESRLGPPAEVVEGDAGDAEARQIRPKPPGSCRTLIFRNFDGDFVVRLKAEDDRFICFGSSWVNKRRYY